jgi:carboxypeptidase family protein
LRSSSGDGLRFERELKTYAEPISADELKKGSIYFFVNFVDEEMLIPTMDTVVYIGENLELGDEDRVYFQDIDSFNRGVRYDGEGDGEHALFQTGSKHEIGHVFNFEHALDQLLAPRPPRPSRRALRGMKVLAALLTILLAPALVAGAVHVNVVDRSLTGRCGTGVSVSAVPESGTPVEGSLTAGTKALSLALDDAQGWRLRASAAGCWSTTESWVSATGTNEITLELYAAAALHGVLIAPAGDPPGLLHASAFRIAPDSNGAAPFSEPEALDCVLDRLNWDCTVPAEFGHDVRLEPDGFAPVHLWNVTLRPAEKRLVEPQKIVRGASVAGWVQKPDGLPLADSVMTLAPLQPEHENAGRAGASQYKAKSNARGFFQFTGVAPGDYRLVSRTAEYPPAVVPVLTVRPLAALTWPRPLRHAHPVTMRVSIDPPKTKDGSSWRLTLTERMPLIPGTAPVVQSLTAGEDGVWSASGLRADVYELVVKDSGEAVVERRDLDLTNGAPEVLTLTIHGIAMTGSLSVGDEPLAAADVRFTSVEGKIFYVTTDENGRFAASFPSPGRWTPLVYPFGRERRAQVRAAAVEVPAEGDAMLEIVLPGGRLRGTVATKDGTPVKAAVHVVKGSALAAQQLTMGNGEFDFLGLSEGSYAVSAEADEGATARPLDVDVRENDTTDVKLTLEPYRIVRGTVYVPSGQPASGSVVRISTDHGISWTDLVAGVQGDFAYALPGAEQEALLVVVTYSYPAAIVRVPVGASGQPPVSITLQPLGGLVEVQPRRAYIIRGDLPVPLNTFDLPNSMGLSRGVHLEPGSYSVCRQPRIEKSCRQVLVAPGTSATVTLPTTTSKENGG